MKANKTEPNNSHNFLSKFQKGLLGIYIILVLLYILFGFTPEIVNTIFFDWAFDMAHERAILILGSPMLLVLCSFVVFTFSDDAVGDFYVAMLRWTNWRRVGIIEFVATVLFYTGVIGIFYYFLEVVPVFREAMSQE